MARHWRRCIGFGSILLPIGLLLLPGCSSQSVMEVNKAAEAGRISYTDEDSRLLAERCALLLQAPAEDYQVGPEDLLEISVFEWEVHKETRVVDVRVGQSGKVSLPIIGEIAVEGLSANEIKNLLVQRLKEDGVLQFPRVNVLVKEYNSKRVAVIGAVEKPGVYPLRKNATTLFEALTLAGGVTDEAGQVLYVIRAGAGQEVSSPSGQDKRLARVDLFELLEMGGNLNLALNAGDVVNVPKAKEFYVVGFVRQPGGFPLNKPTTVLDAVALAGGLREREASPSACVLKRRGATKDIPLNLVAISRGKAPNHYLMAGDVVDVRQTGTKRACLAVTGTFLSIFSVGYSLNR